VRFKEIDCNLHAGTRVVGGRMQNIVIPPEHPVTSKGADVIERIRYVYTVGILAHAGADGGGDRVGKVGDAEKVQKVKPEGV